jgi:UDP-N-acetylglucosamine 2-epimerase (non-hydrolysing)
MLDNALKLFKINPDFDLDVMRPNQTLSSLTGRVIDTVENACNRFMPNIVLVQGDTTTVFASALAAYYCKIAVGHKSILFMPFLFIVLGMPVDVLMVIAFYSWGM